MISSILLNTLKTMVWKTGRKPNHLKRKFTKAGGKLCFLQSDPHTANSPEKLWVLVFGC